MKSKNYELKFTIVSFISLIVFLLCGCINTEKIQKQKNITLTQQDIKISSPVTPCKTSQKDFSLPFYNSAEIKAGYKCVSTLPDGKTGYISRCEFYSSDTSDDIAEWYKRKRMYIRYIDMPDCRKVIISDNKEMTVYPCKGKKSGSTLVMFRNEPKACTELIYTGFKLASADKKEANNQTDERQ